MSEIKVNTIKPTAGSQVTVTAQVLGVPGTDPNHFATVSQLGGAGAGGISRAEAQNLVDDGVATANRHSDERDSIQNSELQLAIDAAKNEAIVHSDSRDFNTLVSANAYTDSKFANRNPNIVANRVIGSNTVTLDLDEGTWFVECIAFEHLERLYPLYLTLRRTGQPDLLMGSGWGNSSDAEGTDDRPAMGFAQVEVTNPEGETISIILTDARGGAWAPGSEHLYAKAIQINPNGGRGSTPIDLSGYAWSTTTSKTYDTWYRNDSPNPIYVSVVSQGLAHEDGSTQLLYTPIGTGTPSGIPLSEVGGINVEGQVNTQKSTAFGWIPPNHYYKVVRVGVSINPDNWRITYWNEYRDDTAHIAPMRYVMFDQPITYCEPGPGPTLTSANGFTGEVAECNNVLSSCGVPREARMVHAAVYHGSANQSRVLKAGIRHTTGSQTVTRFIREVAAAQDDGGGGDRNIANFILPLPAYSNINDTDSKLIFFLYNQSDTPVTASNGYSFFWCKIWGYWI